MRVKRPEEEPFEIMLIPMIDCMLVIIIFFLVATTMKKVTEEQVKIRLPGPALAAGPAEDTKPLVVGIDESGAFYLDNKPVGQGDLVTKLRGLGGTSPGQPIRIDVDRLAPSRALVQVLDLCVYEGLKNYAIHTERKK